MKTQTLTEDLASIRTLMENTRFAAMDNGRYLIAWGLTLSAGIAYSELHNLLSLRVSPWIVWIALLAGAWLYTIFSVKRERHHARTKSYFGRLLAGEWMACGISMTVALVVGGLTGAVPSHAIAGLTASFLAIAVMATARLTGVRWLTLVAVLWWVCALVLFLIPPTATGLALLGCLLVLFVLPGALLNAEARKLAARTL